MIISKKVCFVSIVHSMIIWQTSITVVYLIIFLNLSSFPRFRHMFRPQTRWGWHHHTPSRLGPKPVVMFLHHGINYQPQLLSLPDFWTINSFFYIFSFLFLDDKLRCEKQVPYTCNMSNVCIYIYISWWTATLKLIGFCQLYIQYTLTTIRGGQCNRNIPHHVFVHRFANLLMFLVRLFHSELRVCQLNHHKARPWQL